MSDRRYSPGHTVLHASVFAIPMLPLCLVPLVHGDSSYPKTYIQLGMLWGLGLGVNFGLIAVHEIAHFVVAWATRIEIKEIVIGHWRKVVSVKIGTMQVTIRAAPDSGYVVANPSLNLFSGARVSAFLLGGVIAEAIVVLSVALFSPPISHGPTSFGEHLTAYWQMCIFCFGSLHVIFNLLPHDGLVGGALLPTDGKQLLQFWKSRHNLPAQRALLSEAQRIDPLLKAKKFAEALPLVESLAAKNPDNLELQKLFGNVLAESGRVDDALGVWLKLLERSGMSQSQLASILDSVSCVPIYYGRSDLLARADAWTNEALRYVPSAITLKGTRGSVLVELGRIDEGLVLLREVVRRSDDITDQTISLAYLAKIAAIQGDHSEAEKLLTKARSVDPDHHVVKRISAELSGVATPSHSQRL